MDVSEANFQTAVIDRSKTVPVVVDFWAQWCGPCRQLGPILERAVAARAGEVELAKVDTDANQRLARAFNIQGIPAVKAFKDARVHSEFVGALPAPQVEAFLDALVPSPADRLVAAGDEDSLRQALELQPGRPDAAVPLARILITRGEIAEAQTILGNVAGSFAADGLAARIRLEQGEEADDLSLAFKRLDEGDLEGALDLLLERLPAANGARDELRRVIVGILDELGPESELARTARRRLAAALY